MTLSVWLAFVIATFVLLSIPGITVAMIFSQLSKKGRGILPVTIAGIVIGDCLAVILSLCGLGALLAASATAFTVLKWIGGLYLVWLGISHLNSAGASAKELDNRSVKRVRVRGLDGDHWSGFFVPFFGAILHPKTYLFLATFLPQFLNPAGSFIGQGAILVLTFTGLSLVMAVVWSFLAIRVVGRVVSNEKPFPLMKRWSHRLGGVSLIILGGLALLAKRQA